MINAISPFLEQQNTKKFDPSDTSIVSYAKNRSPQKPSNDQEKDSVRTYKSAINRSSKNKSKLKVNKNPVI